MPVLSDFTTIIGDQSVTIGDNNHENGFTKTFNTGGRRAGSTVFISFMVRGMTATDERAEVFVNDQKVGILFNYKGGQSGHWHTQSISLNGSVLNDGDNTLRVSPVLNAPGATGGGTFDDYQIRNVICHFHQNA